MKQPFISIITCTKNNGLFLENCLQSVAEQTYKKYEHIFIDANSTDDTTTIIKSYYPNALIYQQVGKGLYNALNLGLKKAKGNIIGFLHADDMFADKDCLHRICDSFEKNDVDYYCSRMEIYDEDLKESFAVLGAMPHTPSLREKLYSSTYFAHPTYYCTRKIIEKVGLYNEHYKVASDIEWLMRLEKLNPRYYFDNKILVKFRSKSGVSSKKYLLALKEELKIKKQQSDLTLSYLIIFSWHFSRRVIRYILEKIGAKKTITLTRKLIFQLNKRK